VYVGEPPDTVCPHQGLPHTPGPRLLPHRGDGGEGLRGVTAAPHLGQVICHFYVLSQHTDMFFWVVFFTFKARLKGLILIELATQCLGLSVVNVPIWKLFLWVLKLVSHHILDLF
jgi:hypothetical protein